MIKEIDSSPFKECFGGHEELARVAEQVFPLILSKMLAQCGNLTVVSEEVREFLYEQAATEAMKSAASFVAMRSRICRGLKRDEDRVVNRLRKSKASSEVRKRILDIQG